MALVKVGCKLPHGINCEMGYSVVRKDNGKEITDYSKSDAYRSVVLNGQNSNLIAGAPATRNQRPGYTMVDEEFIKAWLKKNEKLGFVKAGMIWIVAADDASAKAQEIDSASKKTGFEPLSAKDVPKNPITGEALIEKRTDD